MGHAAAANLDVVAAQRIGVLMLAETARDDAFGALYVIMIAFMLPAFSYLIGSFDPVWLRFFPTYPVLQVFKAAMLGKTDVPYALAVLAGFLAGGAAILAAAEARFKKTLTV